MNVTSLFPAPEQPVIDDSASSLGPEERLRAGQCPCCGQQLYYAASKVLTMGRRHFRHKKNLKPLTIAGRVERGQCLQCHASAVTSTRTCATGTGTTVNDFVTALIPISTGTPMVPDQPTTNLMSHGGDDATRCLVVASAVTPPLTTTSTYSGPVNEYGERHGYGVLQWSNGNTYSGDFLYHCRSGQGTMQFCGDGEYVGEWHSDEMHGMGTRRFGNGNVYVGHHVANQRSGQGRLYYANGDLYVGAWDANQIHGWGRYYYSSGQRFEGTFRHGQRWGIGKLQRVDGSVELGRYEHDRRVLAVRWSTNQRNKKAYKIVGGKKISISHEEAWTLAYQMENEDHPLQPTM